MRTRTIALGLGALLLTVALGWLALRPRAEGARESVRLAPPLPRPHSVGAEVADSVDRARETIATEGRTSSAEGERAVLEPLADDQPRSIRDENATSGMRLGRTRSDLEVVRARLARLRENLASLEATAAPAVVERQRARVRAFEERIVELEAEERELRERATREGTLRDEDLGYAEGEEERARLPIDVGG